MFIQDCRAKVESIFHPFPKYVDNKPDIPILNVSNLSLLHYLIGDIKSELQAEGWNIYYRGQIKEYGTIYPSMLRWVIGPKEPDGEIKKLLTNEKSKIQFLEHYQKFVLEILRREFIIAMSTLSKFIEEWYGMVVN